MRTLIGLILATQMTLPCRAENFALGFDGARGGALVENPMVSAGTEFTWEAWVQPGSPPFGGRIYFYRGHYHDKAIGIGSQRAGSCDVEFHVLESVSGGGVGERNPVTTVSFTPSDWFHVAVSYDGISMKIFINGENAVTEPAPQFNGHMNWTEQTYGNYIGTNLKEVEGPPFFRGVIDEVRVWSVARTEVELRDNMHRHLDGPEQGLLGAWSFDEGDGQVLHDASGEHHDGLLGLSEAVEPLDPSWVPSTAPVTYSEAEVTERCGYAPMGVGFALRDTSDLTSVTWDFGDGTSSTALSPTHTYIQPHRR